MSDAEIVRSCGEAMGWHFERSNVYGDAICREAWRPFNPLTSDTDCMLVLYHCAHKGIDVDLYNYAHVRKWGVSFSLSADETMLEYNDQDIEAQFRRAVCIAFLKYKGLWEEEK